MSKMLGFIDWVWSELEQRGWSQSDLSRNASLSRATISNILNQKSEPGIESCRGIANAFGLPAELVLRKAGLIPDQQETEDIMVRIITNIAEKLDERGQEEVKRYAEYQLQIQEKQQRYNVHKNGNQQAEATP